MCRCLYEDKKVSWLVLDTFIGRLGNVDPVAGKRNMLRPVHSVQLRPVGQNSCFSLGKATAHLAKQQPT